MTHLSKSGTYLVGLVFNAWVDQNTGVVHLTMESGDPEFPKGAHTTVKRGIAADRHIRDALARLQSKAEVTS